LAHQWFGDLVTCRDWGHIWLNEGFATYMEMLYREHREGWPAAMAMFLIDLDGAMADARGDGARPLVARAYDDPGDLFDGTSYGKGAWVLHALRGVLDDDRVFFAGLREYARRFAHTPVETAQLRRVMEDVSGRDLRRFFEQWTERPGFPALSVSYRWDDEARALRVAIRQTQDTAKGTPVYRLPVDLRVARGDEELDRRRLVVDRASTEIAIPCASRPDVVEVDPRAWLPATVEIAWPRADALAALAHGSTFVTRRRAIARLGELGLDAEVAAAMGAAAPRSSWSEAEAMARATAKADAEVAMPLLAALLAHPESRARAAAARALRDRKGVKEAVTLARRALDDPSLRVAAAAGGALSRLADADDALDALEPLVALDSPRDTVRVDVLWAIGDVGGKRAIAIASRYAGERETPNVRRRALHVMGRAARGDAGLRKAVMGKLVKALDAPDPRVREGAIAGLEALGTSDAREALDRIAEHDPDASVRDRASAAREAVGKLVGDVGRLEAVEERLRGLEGERAALRAAVERLQKRVESLEKR
ncbi:MAG: HEAT repeat domain-containing protein, partial [Myxococcales bacterium]|nr:HEAT repeat domain-containing protein [Myxococcales bacterium]